MFYSHEILSNRQYGVSTIWLVANLGQGDRKRLSKKAVEGVDVPKACKKILEPGAPLALRLQGSLLYGVSRVFSQQCGYVLTEAEKTQSNIISFLDVSRTNDVNPQALKTKRLDIILQDDPTFDLMSALPNLDRLGLNKMQMLPYTQGSLGDCSHLTPLGSSQLNTPSNHSKSALVRLELPSSSHSAASCRIPSVFGHTSPLLNTGAGAANDDRMAELKPLMEDYDPVLDMGFEFDGHGESTNVEFQEPDLPALPGLESAEIREPKLLTAALAQRKEKGPAVLLEGDEVYQLGLEEPALPDAAAFPTRSRNATDAAREADGVSAKMPRKPRVKAMNMLDSAIGVTSGELRRWRDDYADNMTAIRKRPMTTTAPAQARKNAMAFLFGNGIANIGTFRGADGAAHPLADDFAGSSLERCLMGNKVNTFELETEAKRRGRRRKSDELLDGQDDDSGLRPTSRRRVDEEAEFGRGGSQGLDDASFAEMGMDAAPLMEDRHSSSVMPWSRPGSAVPGSSVRGSAQKPKTAPSPLFGRGSILNSVDRYSDAAEASLGLDNPGSQGFSYEIGGEEVQPACGVPDGPTQDFLDFATRKAVEKGDRIPSDKKNQRWIDFDELVPAGAGSREAAAGAFMQVLTLAAKKCISVEQDGVKAMKPFGSIRIGVDVETEHSDSEDELSRE